jgi:hypothetical protein
MDSVTLDRYRQIIESILLEYTKIPYAYGEIQTEAVFDRVHDRYLLVNTGWDFSGQDGSQSEAMTWPMALTRARIRSSSRTPRTPSSRSRSTTAM